MSAPDHLNPGQFPDVHLYHAVNELAHNGDPGDNPITFSHEDVHPRSVRFQRYPESDPRVQSAMEGYRSGVEMPPVLTVRRAGEHMTADGHHRLTAAELLGRSVPAQVAISPREDAYAGKARIGTLRKPRAK